MIPKNKLFGWLTLGGAFAIWPVLIASSFVYMPQPLASISAMAHGFTFIFIGIFGIYLLLPDRGPFHSPLPPLPDRPADDLFRYAKGTVEGGETVFPGEKGNETNEMGGSAWGEKRRGASRPPRRMREGELSDGRVEEK